MNCLELTHNSALKTQNFYPLPTLKNSQLITQNPELTTKNLLTYMFRALPLVGGPTARVFAPHTIKNLSLHFGQFLYLRLFGIF